jgi:hypothetical protein
MYTLHTPQGWRLYRQNEFYNKLELGISIFFCDEFLSFGEFFFNIIMFLNNTLFHKKIYKTQNHVTIRVFCYNILNFLEKKKSSKFEEKQLNFFTTFGL